MRNGFLAAALIPLAVAGLAQAQVGYGPQPAGPGGAYPLSSAGSPAGMAAAGAPGAPPGVAAAGAPGGVPAPNYPPPYGRPDYGAPVEEGGYDRTPNSLFFTTEGLLYFLRPNHASYPLVTQGTGPSLGQLDQTGTTVLFDRSFDVNPLPGVRANLVKLMGEDQSWGLTLGGFYLPKQLDTFKVNSDLNGSPLLARPFFNALTESPSSLLIAAPGFVSGGIAIEYGSTIWSANSDILFNCYKADRCCVQGSIGVRYLELEEYLHFLQVSHVLANQQAPFGGLRVTGPATISVIDRIYTKNMFAGGEIGVQGTFTSASGRLFGQLGINVALGELHQILDISGSSVLDVPRSPVLIAKGGLYGTASNIGHYNEDTFSCIPQASARIGFKCCDCCSMFVGYDLMFLTNVIRPADQIDPTISSGQLPTSAFFGTAGPARPLVEFKKSDAYLHGLTVGLTLTY